MGPIGFFALNRKSVMTSVPRIRELRPVRKAQTKRSPTKPKLRIPVVEDTSLKFKPEIKGLSGRRPDKPGRVRVREEESVRFNPETKVVGGTVTRESETRGRVPLKSGETLKMFRVGKRNTLERVGPLRPEDWRGKWVANRMGAHRDIIRVELYGGIANMIRAASASRRAP